MKFDKKEFGNKSMPSVEEIKIRNAVEKSEDKIQEALEGVAKMVIHSQLGITKEMTLEEMLAELDENHISINVSVAHVDGKVYATFTVSMIVDAVELDV